MMAKATAILLALTAALPAVAHRLDEYLQATIVSVTKHEVRAEMTLTPGSAIFSKLFAFVDTNADGAISEAEQCTYAGRVLNDLSVKLDGARVTPQLISIRFPALDEMKDGRGEIQLDFKAALPTSRGPRKLTIENRHLRQLSVYQVNCLVPDDPDIRIAAQYRDYEQTQYELDYRQSGGGWALPALFAHAEWLSAVPLFLFVRLGVLWLRRGA